MPTTVESFNATIRLGEILNGKCSTDLHRQIYNRFWAVFSREMFKRMHRSYKLRARKQSDDLPAWNPLKPETIFRKRNRRKPPPSKHPTWINYDTGKLLGSYRPGTIAGNKYIPPPHQIWKLATSRLTLGSKVKYAERVSQLRDLFPHSRVLVRWSKESAEIAAKAVIPLLGKSGKYWPDKYPGYWPFRNERGQFTSF